jgi:hypothetical protein|nr:hypothetical protein [Thauera sp.]
MEQLGGIAIENRWPFAHGRRCELVGSTRSELRRSLEDRGYLGMLLTEVSGTWWEAWPEVNARASRNWHHPVPALARV